MSGRKKTPLFRVIVLPLDTADRQEPFEVLKNHDEPRVGVASPR
jgi:hypothetical protein